jgi:3-oxoacyl-[acyl-carrier-protein] synthase-3
MNKVYITRTSHFLPNEPVSNDEMEVYLGEINDTASKSKRIVLRNNGIKSRYYAMTKEGVATHTNAEMVALAIEKLFEGDKEEIKEVDLIACGTSSPDQLMPSHAVMVHGFLPESGNIEVVSPSGVCCSGMHALKYAYMSLQTGHAAKAVCSGSERLSRTLRSDQYENEIHKLIELEQNPYISFEKDFLRWMLSDGAGTFLLENKPNPNGISLEIEWMEGVSFANEVEVCMYMAADFDENRNLKSYKDFTPTEVLENSVLSIKQDTKLLGENIIKLGFKRMIDVFKRKNINADQIDYFLPHMSSYFFENKIYDQLVEWGYTIPKDRWFTNLETHGNVGAGSIFLMLDQLFNSGQLKKGEKVLLAVPESSRFSYMFCMLTVC